MSDFFKQDLTDALNPPVGVTSEVPQSIKLGDKEYTQEELQEAVGARNMVKELEEKWDTKIDKVYPKFTQNSTRLKEVENELNELKQKQSTADNKPIDEIDEETKAEAKRAARKLDLLTKDDLTDLGYISKDDFQRYYKDQRESEKLLDNMNSMQKDIDGEDGRPAFKTQEVLEYMSENRLVNPEIAYKLMNEGALDSWKEKKISEVKKPGLVTDTSSSVGVKLPPEVKVTKENRDAMLKAALRGE